MWSIASRLPWHLLLKLMGMIQCTDQASHFNDTALKWTDLDQDVAYQITVNIQHGQSVILSLQKADGSSCSAWACGIAGAGSSRAGAEPRQKLEKISEGDS